MLEKILSDLIADYWFDINPYCGLSSNYLFEKLQGQGKDISANEIEAILKKMESEGLLSIRQIESGDRVRWVWENSQLREIVDQGPHIDIWVYPKRKLLEKYDNSKVEEVGIYMKQLRLGGSQIEHRFFRRQVLDRYREDPRYHFGEFGPSGYIEIKDEFYLDKTVPEEDKIGIQSFGYGYDTKGEQIVAVILVYLGKLSVKHQNHWHSYEISEPCELDSDYVKQNFEAEFIDRISIYEAFVQELKEINTICRLMGEPSLFRNTYKDELPRQFGRLTKPTRSQYDEFIHILDKMTSDNINRNFFKNKTELKEEIETKDGKTKTIDKSTIRLLEEYFEKHWRFPDPKPKDEMIKTFKQIRQDRQDPAHRIVDDKYDVGYFHKQNELMVQAYSAIRTLRLILQNHPKAKDYEPPKWLNEGRII